MEPKRIIVLASGRGSNFAAIADGIKSGSIPNAILMGLICNKAQAGALALAEERGIPTHLIESKKFKKENRFDREAYETELLRLLEELNPDLICLAGYMLLLGEDIVRQFPEQIINIHPSLLPKFRGLNAQRQAIQSEEIETGCTVHFITEALDDGPIILQKKIPIRFEDDEESLTVRLLPVEHEAYCEALKLICTRPYEIKDGKVVFTQ